jgi:uncharacterized protein YfeS
VWRKTKEILSKPYYVESGEKGSESQTTHPSFTSGVKFEEFYEINLDVNSENNNVKVLFKLYNIFFC